MADHRREIENSDALAGVRLDDLTGRMLKPRKEIVEVPYPIRVVESGITQVGNVGISPLGLVIPETGISSDEWQALFFVIRDVRKSWQFMIGDWFAYGADKFEYTYAEIAEWTGYQESTVKTFASICRNVSRLIRVNSLEFGHHRAVAKLPHEMQITALNYASEQQLSVRAFRTYLGEKTKKKRGRKKGFNIIDATQLQRLRKADIEERKKMAQQLRALADELER